MTTVAKTSTVAGWKNLLISAQSLSVSNIKKLYMKDGLLAIHKPYGIPVHGGPKIKLSIADFLPALEQKHGLLAGSLELAHRLDKNTSGVLLLTYKKEMAKYLADLHENRKIEKSYLAILLGNVSRVTGVLNGELQETLRNGQFKQTINEISINKSSVETNYTILDSNQDTCMLCLFKTFTGNKHQIRVHAYELLKCPILGDHRYHANKGPQTLPIRLIQMLRMRGVKNEETGSSKIRPWQRGLLPMHLLTKSIRIPGLDGSKDLTIETSIPSYFQQTMDHLDLVLNREEVDAARLRKKHKLLKHINRRESLFVSKGISINSESFKTSV
ncbi:pseudouridylate synthase RPUSD4, mitochondrial [Hydra vulgaris]|uniref:Pseudouridylate synthase RPUSD4, mitochondrial n=1 Tax=Hydra vulgaris TaxID=6087 RepID=A0ABM4BQM3_HYDVU